MTAASRFKEQGISTGNVTALIITGLFAAIFIIFVISEATSGGISVEVEVTLSGGNYDTWYVGGMIKNVGDVDIGLSYLMVQINGNWQRVETIEFLPIGGGSFFYATLSSVTSGRYNGKFVLADGSYVHNFTFVIY